MHTVWTQFEPWLVKSAYKHMFTARIYVKKNGCSFSAEHDCESRNLSMKQVSHAYAHISKHNHLGFYDKMLTTRIRACGCRDKAKQCIFPPKFRCHQFFLFCSGYFFLTCRHILASVRTQIHTILNIYFVSNLSRVNLYVYIVAL